MENGRYHIHWKGEVLLKKCSDCITADSIRSLKPHTRGVMGSYDVDEAVIHDTEKDAISKSVDPLVWEEKPEDFEDHWNKIHQTYD